MKFVTSLFTAGVLLRLQGRNKGESLNFRPKKDPLLPNILRKWKKKIKYVSDDTKSDELRVRESLKKRQNYKETKSTPEKQKQQKNKQNIRKEKNKIKKKPKKNKKQKQK